MRPRQEKVPLNFRSRFAIGLSPTSRGIGRSEMSSPGGTWIGTSAPDTTIPSET